MSDSNTLKFSLGLETANFLKGFAAAEAKLSGFSAQALKFTGVGLAFEGLTKSLEGMGNVVQGVMSAFERGNALEHLHKQTGESVSSLFLLQKGLKAVGLDASGAGSLVFQLEKSLGGINDAGEPTAHVFGQLGLQIDDLKKMDAPAAIEAIAKKMEGLNNSSATAAASKIFGRGGAKEFLQLARSSDEFTQALKGNAQAAAMAERTAAGFAKIDQSLNKLKSKSDGLFAGIAEGLAPAITDIVGILGKLDLSGLGQEIGRVTAGFVELFKVGELGKFLMDALRVSFDTLPSLALAGIQKCGALLIAMMETPLIYLQAGLEKAIQQAMEVIGKIPGIGTATGLSGFKAESWEDIIKSRKETGAEFFTKGNTSKKLNADADKSVVDARQQVMAGFAPLYKMLDQLGGKRVNTFERDFNGSKIPGTENLQGDDDDEKKKKAHPYQASFTALEKLGLDRGGAGIVADGQKETAQNTKQLVTLTKQVLTALNPLAGIGYNAANGHP